MAIGMANDPFGTLREFKLASGTTGKLHSLPALAKTLKLRLERLPVSLRIVLESLVRNCDGNKITEAHVRQLAGWQPNAPRSAEIPFIVARILLQDFTGVPLLCDLAAMRSAAARLGNAARVEPLVPVDLVIDHSIQVDYYNASNALDLNMKMEFQRNAERYRFLKWGMQAFATFKVVPPGIGIVHQVNLEYLSRGVHERSGLYYPDTLVGTDSHTTMINGLGVVGWGVGGIEAEAGMLGQPVYFLTPDVVGVHLKGRLREGATATDLVLNVTELLRNAKVVGQFVEFFGEGAASLAVPDRATIGNMAPEYGATMGFFPIDEATVDYLRITGRSEKQIDAFAAYYRAQNMFGMPVPGQCDYSRVLELDLQRIQPSVAGPSRPQDRIELPALKSRFAELFGERPTRYPVKPGPASAELAGGGDQSAKNLPNGSAKNVVEMVDNRPTPNLVRDSGENVMERAADLGNGDVLIAAITSCTNTSNPGVLLAAGLLARNAVQKGLAVRPHIKTSLAPGSRVVTEYLRKAGLLSCLEKLGFGLVGYGCTTCIGNSGPLDPQLEETLGRNGVIAAAVLSGNRNFEARIHASIKANFLMSPPLVVAFAIAGRIGIDMSREPLGRGTAGSPVFLKDVWPSEEEIAEVMHYATDPAMYRTLYADFTRDHPLWNAIPATGGQLYPWHKSSYIAEPPFFAGFGMQPADMGAIRDARALAIFGDSVTTDHISPAGSIEPASPAGKYLQENGVAVRDFNSYGSRRGNHEVMLRGTFANVRIKNLMVPGTEGGMTLFKGEKLPIYDAAMRYRAEGCPTIVFAGEEYGSGSSRDWAAKGTQLLGVKAVVAKSFERIHRSNLVGMGVLPCQLKGSDSVQSLGIKGDETFDVLGIESVIKAQQDVALILRKEGSRREIPVRLRIDTPVEVDYYRHGGILPYVLRQLMAD